jgi:peptidoglycan/LPS O-acetylase OafA/YrhL
MVALLSLVGRIRQRFQRKSVSTKYKPEIDGLRFFAIIIVLICHTAERVHRPLLAHGVSTENDLLFLLFSEPGNGVLLFYAISGFIISQQFLRRQSISNGYIAKYFRRRFLRIAPPYYLILTGSYIAVAIMGYVPRDVKQMWKAPQSFHLSFIASLAFLHGLFFGTMPKLFSPGWTLEIEMQFYALAPLILGAYSIARTRRTRMFAAVGGLIMSILVEFFSWYLTKSSVLGLHWDRTVLGWLIYFWIGVICSDFQQDFKLSFWTASILGSVGLVVMEFDGFLFHAQNYVVLRAVVNCLAVILVFASVLSPKSVPKWICVNPLIYITGGFCYSIYLTHLQVIQMVTQITYSSLSKYPEIVQLGVQELISIAAAGLAGGIYYMYIERPTMEPDWPSKLFARISVVRRIRVGCPDLSGNRSATLRFWMRNR